MGYSAAILAVAALGASVASGESQRREAKRARRSTENAQNRAQGQALRQEREAAAATKRANRVEPDVSAFLAQNENAPSTALSGSAGVKPDELLLSRVTPLGT